MYDVAKITVVVSDLDASIRFYTEILGLKLKHRLSNRWAEIEAPGMIIGLRPRMDPNAAFVVGDSHLLIGLWVKDLDEARNTLEGRGVYFEGEIVEFDPVRLLFFNDPDLTPLYICQATSDIYQLQE